MNETILSDPSIGTAKATRREWIGLTVIALPCMIYSMDLTVLNLAIPALTKDLKPSASQLLWIIDIYGFMVAGFLISMGSLGDRIGRRKLLMLGAALFGLASTVAAYSTSAEMLIVMRAVLGIAGATLAPSTLSLISVMFRDEKERTFAISMWIASFSVGAIIGPLIGGFIIQYFAWGWVFLIAVPVMALLLVIGPLLLPEYKAPEAGPADIMSGLMSLTSVLLVIYGVKQSAEFGFGLVSALMMSAGAVVGYLFVRRQMHLSDPMIDLGLFRIRAFSAALCINLASFVFMFGSFIFIGQYFQLVAGLSAFEAGLWSLPSAIGFTVASFVTPTLSARLNPTSLMAGGLGVAAVGFLGMALSRELLPIVIASTVFSVGFTPVVVLNTGLVIEVAPPERTGVASAMSETAAELGGALGIALLGSLGTAIYRSQMAAFSAVDLPPDATLSLRSTLAGAVAVASGLPADQAKPLIEAARSAYMTGFHLAAWLAVFGMIFCVIIALTTLPRRGAGDGVS